MLFKSHVSHLYNHQILFKGFDINNKQGYKSTLDYKIYKQYLDQGKDKPGSIYTSLMRRLHDHSITDALEEAILNCRIVKLSVIIRYNSLLLLEFGRPWVSGSQEILLTAHSEKS